MSYYDYDPRKVESSEYRRSYNLSGLADTTAAPAPAPTLWDQIVSAAQSTYQTVAAVQANQAAARAPVTASSAPNYLLWGGVGLAAIALIAMMSKK